MTKYNIRFFCLLFIPLFGTTQTEQQLFSVAELQEDFSFWREKLEAKSPLIYYYETKEATDNYFDSIYALIDHPMTDIAFYNLISPTTSFLKDVHSGIQPSNTIDQKIINHSSIIPIDIAWLDSKAYVAVSDSANSMKEGTQVLKINDVDIDKIFQAGFIRMPNDGYSKSYSRFLVNSNFWFVYHRSYGFSEEYKIEYLSKSGLSETTTLKGTNWKSLKRKREGTNRPLFKDDLPLISLDFNDSLNTAILTILSFDNKLFKYTKQEKFDPSIKKAFKQINSSGVTNLIIDIRGNEGGDPVNAALVLRYLLFEKFQISKELRMVKNGEAVAFNERTKKKWIPFYGLGKYKPKKDLFNGDTYVLINGGTSSAAGEFAGEFQKHNRGQFIGTETGGNPILLSGSVTSNLHILPNTKLKSFVGTLCSIDRDIDKNKGYGLLPDHMIELSPIDLAKQIDPVASYTYELIQRRNTQKQVLNQLKDSINSQYGLYEGAPCVNSGPCGNFANLLYLKWNDRFTEKVNISFIMSADSSECYHVLIKLPNGDYYDGGNGILTKQQLIEGYEKGMYVIDMLEYDYQLLDEMSYGLEREYPRCPNYSAEETSEIINFHLDQLKRVIN